MLLLKRSDNKLSGNLEVSKNNGICLHKVSMWGKSTIIGLPMGLSNHT